MDMRENRVWKRPTILPLPEKSGDEETVRLLSGEDWKLCRKPGGNVWEESEGEEWERTTVPLQQPYQEQARVYARNLEIPEEWEGKRIFLRFEGVCCEAKVYINAKLAGSHYGGFVSWDCEITSFVKNGEAVRLTVTAQDDPNGICSFQFGGIIRDVRMFAVPVCHIARFHAKTELDEEYKNARLMVKYRLAGGDGWLDISLTDPEGRRTVLGKVFGRAEEDAEAVFSVQNPR